jgi:transposase
LLLAVGLSVHETAEYQGLCREAVRVRRRKALKLGLASLPDRPRSGAPGKLTDAQREPLDRWVEAEPLSSRELLSFRRSLPLLQRLNAVLESVALLTVVLA